MNTMTDAEQALWTEALPMLDESLDRLKAADREIVLGRFFENRSFREIAASSGSTLALKADLVASREMLGMAYHRGKQPLRAVAALARAVADQPDSPRAHSQLAVVLQAMGWYDGAEKSLLKAIQLDPDYQDAHFNLGLIYLERDPPSLKLARQHYAEARNLGAPADKELEKRLKL